MILAAAQIIISGKSMPRASGDDPYSGAAWYTELEYAPRKRG